jgi:hypothetical protein
MISRKLFYVEVFSYFMMRISFNCKETNSQIKRQIIGVLGHQFTNVESMGSLTGKPIMDMKMN